ncbi:MAG: proteasome subunit beta [Candidatus Poribacteria bacterium]|nr:proteasome subunit beta [Candidatus Poribacteria bacterium]
MAPDQSEYITNDLLQILKCRQPSLLQSFSTNAQFIESTQPRGEVGQFLEGTTILALIYADGVVVAGDRQATGGFQIGERRVQKVYEVDTHSAIAIAGVAGPCIDMAKLFQTQVEFYEKVEGSHLSLEGKASYLSNMLKSNLPLALQGLIVIPIFAGYDLKENIGRIFKYDITGGRYEQVDYYAEGSGGKDARSALKKLYRPEMKSREALHAVLHALWDAADEDVGTAGPDFLRNIYPIVRIIDQSGITEVSPEIIKSFYTDLFQRISENKSSLSESE